MSRDPAVEWDIIEEYEEQIEALPGVSVNVVQALGVGGVALDFSFSWPGEAPAEWPALRREAVENSAIIIENDIYAQEWQIRLPPIPQEGNPRREVEDKLKRQFDRIVEEGVVVRLASDGDVWTPHINDKMMYSPEVEETIKDIQTMWDRYREMVTQGQFGVI